MAASQPANFNLQEFTDVGQLMVGGRLYTYAYGTTTHKTAYTDPDGTVPHTYTPDGLGGQYIALNARGELPAPLYLVDGSYDVSLKRADGSTVWTRKADGVENSFLAWIAALAAGLGAALIGFIQDGVGGVVRTILDKLREWKSPEDYGAVGDGVVDDTAALQKALNATKYLNLAGKNYRTTARLNATIDHVIKARGDSQSSITADHSDHVIVIPAPATDKIASLRLEDFTVYSNNKIGIKVGGDATTHATDGAIIKPRFRVRVVGKYGSTSGDPAYNTDKVRDPSGSLVSCATATSIDVKKTFDDAAQYGIGIQLSKCIDTVIEAPQFYGLGVAVAQIGCDLTHWRGGRAHEVGHFFYDERIAATSWGSQTLIDGVADLLHNRRAGGILLNETKFFKLKTDYYENYSNAAMLVLASGTEGVEIDSNRIDDPYAPIGSTPAAGTTPLMVWYLPRLNNAIRRNLFQKGTPYFKDNPPVRVVNAAANCDTNHPEMVSLENPNGSSGLRFASMNDAGVRFGPLVENLFTPNNVPDTIAGDIAPLAVIDMGRWVFYNANALFPTPRFRVRPPKRVLTMTVDARTSAAGVPTTIFFSVIHKRSDGTTKGTLFSGQLAGFTTGAYATVAQPLTAMVDPTEGDYILATWQSNSAYIAAISIN